MNEMKPEDVMRALECCLQADGAPDCYKLNCPARLGNGLCYYEIDCEFNSEEEALKKMLADALIILRENRSQISVLKKLLDRCETQFAEKDAEIERLNGLLLKAINDAEQDRSQCKNICAPTYKNLLETARAEAIDEFADRLKSTLIAGGIYPVLVKNSIEKIAKGMKGAGATHGE